MRTVICKDLWLIAFGQDHTRETVAQLPPGAPRIALMDNPDTFAKLPGGSAPIALAGHTHGGQVRLPWLICTASSAA